MSLIWIKMQIRHLHGKHAKFAYLSLWAVFTKNGVATYKVILRLILWLYHAQKALSQWWIFVTLRCTQYDKI